MSRHAIAISRKVAPSYVLVCWVAVFTTFILHEFAHWLMGELLDNRMGMSLNSAFPLSGRYFGISDGTAVAAAGPIFTIAQAVLIFMLLYRINNVYFYPFLFTPLYMRILAGFMNIISPNDEGKVSADLGVGMFTLSLLVCLFLYGMVYVVNKKYRYPRKFNVINLLLILLFSSLLILVDRFLKIRIL